jgi:hypothetical protein
METIKYVIHKLLVRNIVTVKVTMNVIIRDAANKHANKQMARHRMFHYNAVSLSREKVAF